MLFIKVAELALGPQVCPLVIKAMGTGSVLTFGGDMSLQQWEKFSVSVHTYLLLLACNILLCTCSRHLFAC